MNEAVASYMEKYRKLEEDFRNYTLYVHGYWLPWLEEQRKLGIIKKGMKTHNHI